MPQIGTFQKKNESKVKEFNGRGGSLVEWENKYETCVYIHVDNKYDKKRKYWVGVTHEGEGGMGPDLGLVFDTKKEAYNKAYKIMKELRNNPGNFQAYMI